MRSDYPYLVLARFSGRCSVARSFTAGRRRVAGQRATNERGAPDRRSERAPRQEWSYTRSLLLWRLLGFFLLVLLLVVFRTFVAHGAPPITDLQGHLCSQFVRCLDYSMPCKRKTTPCTMGKIPTPRPQLRPLHPGPRRFPPRCYAVRCACRHQQRRGGFGHRHY